MVDDLEIILSSTTVSFNDSFISLNGTIYLFYRTTL